MGDQYIDDTTRWNITNSAQNIVSALVDPSKQFDNVFRREWANTFSSTNHRRITSSSTTLSSSSNVSPSSSNSTSLSNSQQQQLIDSEFRGKLSRYLKRLNEREYIKKCEAKTQIEQQQHKINVLPGESDVDQPNLKIPDLFMSEDFDLSRTNTFSTVISKVASPNSTSALSKDQIKELQLELTDYLDLVEEKLANQVRNRSGDFFQVMSSVDSVMDELSLAIKSVTTLRSKCLMVNKNLISPHLKTIHHGKVKQNAKLVLDKLLQIVDLLKVQPTIQLLLSTSDFDNALDMIGKTRIQLRKEFKFIHCLKHLEPQLVEYERLIATMMQQEEKIVHKFHDEHKRKIESSLDNEQWKMIEVPRSFQRLITLLLDEEKSISEILEMIQEDPASLLSMTSVQENQVQDATMTTTTTTNGGTDNNFNGGSGGFNNINNNNTMGNNDIGSNNNDSFNSNINNNNNNSNNYIVKNNNINDDNYYVTAMGSKYVIVNSAIILIEIVLDYCKCAQNIRASSADVLEYLFQILQIYNSRTYHLVYSAGAIQVAGLKTITTRCLIVSQRSLKLISLLIPILKRYFSKLLPDYTRLRRFEDISISYLDHVNKIPNRVNIIVKDVINLRLFEWEAKPPVPSLQFQAIAQHIIRLHDNIQIALPLDELILLFKMILETFKSVLINHLRRLNIKNDSGPQQWLVTQELTFFKISLTKLNVFKGWGLNFDDLWTRMNSSVAVSSSSLIMSPSASSLAPSMETTATATSSSSASLSKASMSTNNDNDNNNGNSAQQPHQASASARIDVITNLKPVESSSQAAANNCND